MRCDEAAEYVSALCDGETIPREAAAHVRDCSVCAGLMQEYIALGAALRREASLALCAPPPAPHWETKTGVLHRLWRKGWETMRVPRMAFAALVLLALTAVGAGWKMRSVGAQGNGSVVLLTIEREGQSGAVVCPLSLDDANQPGCAFAGNIDPVKKSGVLFKAAGRANGAVRLIVRSATRTAPPYDLELDKQPGRVVILMPGVPLKLPVEGIGTFILHGEWSDHMPPNIGVQVKNIDPEPAELRIMEPALLREDTRVGDLTGSASTNNGFEHGVEIVFPKSGRYLFSLVPIRDSVEGKIHMGRIDFEYNGTKYTLLTGTPIARQEKVWVQAEPDYKTNSYGISTPSLRDLALNK